jgi:hypothetical protein
VKFKEQPRREPDPEPAERDDVHVAANRCPFCHEDVLVETSVVCQRCLTRHHEACWEESGACSSCSSTQRLISSPLRSGDPQQPSQTTCLIKGCQKVPLPTERGCLEHAILYRRQVAAISAVAGVLLTPLIGALLLAVARFPRGELGWFPLLIVAMFALSLLTFVKAIALIREARRLEKDRPEEEARDLRP